MRKSIIPSGTFFDILEEKNLREDNSRDAVVVKGSNACSNNG